MIFPLEAASRSIFAATREALSMESPRWSSITTSSMMNLLSNPKSMRPTLTFVPNLAESAFDTSCPKKPCTGGRCNSMTSEKYNVTSVQSIPVNIFFKRFRLKSYEN